jgi:tRNA-modifying protein YgfZ
MHYVSAQHQVVAFEGPDALAFLQSQLTNDVAALAIGDWQWQGYCNAKGRLHATFALARTGEATFLAVVHASVVPFIVKRLTMFRLRSKLTIIVSDALRVEHYFEQPVESASRAAELNLGHGRWVTVESKDTAELPAATPQLVERWTTLGIQARQPEIVVQTNEMFVPQMIGWDQIEPNGGVSFSKGCYPGQEVVARAHYRGAVKRELAIERLPMRTSEAIATMYSPGQTFEREDGTIVELVNVSLDTNGPIALAVVPIRQSA